MGTYTTRSKSKQRNKDCRLRWDHLALPLGRDVAEPVLAMHSLICFVSMKLLRGRVSSKELVHGRINANPQPGRMNIKRFDFLKHGQPFELSSLRRSVRWTDYRIAVFWNIHQGSDKPPRQHLGSASVNGTPRSLTVSIPHGQRPHWLATSRRIRSPCTMLLI